MTTTSMIARRPLPSFEQWLAVNGDGTRGDGFKAFVDLAERTHAQNPTGLDDMSLLFLRLWKGMQIAVVELCNIERARGATPAEIIIILPRVLATSAMYGSASVMRDDLPFRTLSKILIQEFRFAAHEAADQMEGARGRQAKA